MNTVRKLFSGAGCVGWLMFLIPVLVAGPFFLIGLSEAFKTARLVASSATAQGTVVDNAYRPFAQGGAAYAPVVEFVSEGGVRAQFVDGIGTIPPEYEVGDQVRVLYDPRDVQSARVYTFKRIWSGPLIVIAVGGVPLLVGIGLMWWVSRKAGVR